MPFLYQLDSFFLSSFLFLSFFLYFFLLWHINVRVLFNAKVILVDGQYFTQRGIGGFTLFPIENSVTEDRKSGKLLCVTYEIFAGFSGHGNSIYNIIPQLKKENIHLFPCPWGYDYADTYLQSSSEDVALEVTEPSVRGQM